MIREDHLIKTEEQLRAVYDQPLDIIADKEVPYITATVKRYIDLAPFLCLGTYDGQGNLDISPKGDAPGFVQVLNNKTLAVPDRPGNNRCDSICNILKCPDVSLIFMIPGVKDTVRVRGKASISTDPELLEKFSIRGKLPRSVIVISVTWALGHCAKCMIRSKLWEDDHRPAKGVAPTTRELLMDEKELPDGFTNEIIDAAIADDYQNNLY